MAFNKINDILVVGIIQARMGSSRLPGKSLMDLSGKPLLYRFIERVKRSKHLDEIVLATTEKGEDDVLVDIAQELLVSTCRGAENDLIDRYFHCATKYDADIVVRLCADNPVVEPAEIDRIILSHVESGADFSSNTHNICNNNYPDGIGAEVYNIGTLEKLSKVTKSSFHREHPHSYIYECPSEFKVGTVNCPDEFARPDLVLDVNVIDEYLFIKELYASLYPVDQCFHITDVIRWYDGSEYAK